MSKMRKGFTLIELIIVIIIIGILATIAVPQFMTATERAKGGKARNALGLIAQGEKLFRADSAAGVYVVGLTKAAINTALVNFIELDQVVADVDWDYAVTVGVTPPTFTITATRIGAGGKNVGEFITLNQAGIFNPAGTDTWTP